MKRIVIVLSVAVLGMNLAKPGNGGIAVGQDAKRPETKPEEAKKVPGPWFGAKVGDTTVHRDSLGQESTRTVTKVDETTVTLEAVGKTGGKVLPKHTLTYPRMVPTDFKRAEELWGGDAEVKDLGTQTLTISGQKLVCKVKQFTSTHEKTKQVTVRKFWYSDQVPGQTVKAETVSNGKTYVNELVEFKRGK
jgi:hypothetical protein